MSFLGALAFSTFYMGSAGAVIAIIAYFLSDTGTTNDNPESQTKMAFPQEKKRFYSTRKKFIILGGTCVIGAIMFIAVLHGFYLADVDIHMLIRNPAHSFPRENTPILILVSCIVFGMAFLWGISIKYFLSQIESFPAASLA